MPDSPTKNDHRSNVGLIKQLHSKPKAGFRSAGASPSQGPPYGREGEAPADPNVTTTPQLGFAINGLGFVRNTAILIQIVFIVAFRSAESSVANQFQHPKNRSYQGRNF